jgi:hypothetical protein
MTKLSQFKQAANYVEALQRPRRAVLELDAAHRPEPVILSATTRSALCHALAHEEATLTSELRALGVAIDTDLPL